MKTYRQYRFKFYLNARHAIFINGKQGEIHPHTWEITLNVMKGRDDFMAFGTLERKMEEMLKPFQDKILNEVEPFDQINPTLENCAVVFKKMITGILIEEGWIFLSMEMSETPSRSFVINITDEKETEREENMERFIHNVLEDIEKYE